MIASLGRAKVMTSSDNSPRLIREVEIFNHMWGTSRKSWQKHQKMRLEIRLPLVQVSRIFQGIVCGNVCGKKKKINQIASEKAVLEN